MIALSSINDPGYVSPSLGSHGRNPPGGARCLAQDSRGNRRSIVRSRVWWVNLTTHEAIRSNPNHVQHDVRYSYSKTYRDTDLKFRLHAGTPDRGATEKMVHLRRARHLRGRRTAPGAHGASQGWGDWHGRALHFLWFRRKKAIFLI